MLAEFWFKNPDGLTVIPCSQFLKVSFSQESFNQHDFSYKLKGENREIFELYVKIINEKGVLEKKLQESYQVPCGTDVNALKDQLNKKNEEFEKIYRDVKPILLNLRSILVLDHIEESDFGVMQEALSDVLERGKLIAYNSDSSWEISFVNSIIFITCNDCVPFEKGSQNDFSKIGFMQKVPQPLGTIRDGKIRYLKGMEELKNYLSPKFISRIDRVEILKEYSELALLEILNLLFDEFAKWLKDNFPVMLIVEDEVKKYIVHESIDHSEFGIWLLKNKSNISSNAGSEYSFKISTRSIRLINLGER